MKRFTVVLGITIALLFFMMNLPVRGYVVSTAYPVFRTIEARKTENRTKDLKQAARRNVRVFYHDQDDVLAVHVLDLAETRLKNLEKFYEYCPKKVDIILYSSREGMVSDLGISEDQEIMGAYYGGRIHLLSPQALNQEDGEVFEEQMDNTILHEMTHLFVDEMSKGNFPLWFTEGNALYMEYLILGYEWAADIDSMHYFSMDELESHFERLDANLAYKQSFLLTRHLIQGMDKQKYLEIIRRLAWGEDLNQVIPRQTGTSMDGWLRGI